MGAWRDRGCGVNPGRPRQRFGHIGWRHAGPYVGLVAGRPTDCLWQGQAHGSVDPAGCGWRRRPVCAFAIQQDPGAGFPGRPLDCVHLAGHRPRRGVRRQLSHRRQSPPGFRWRRHAAALAAGWLGAVLPGAGPDADGRARDEQERIFRCRPRDAAVPDAPRADRQPDRRLGRDV